ncbi:hypothetical protein K9B33_20935 [Sphingobium sp. 3R8]|uniref:head-tail connector protein n=1 Tax=Sphingobium sp. 3R8 TaxID=2874921 RepID=UPI001CCB7438|nr:hypothetical protein [Sphingobium sp. 3R8]MBZ9650004.1 hypothetical protein [Sphingobium sp. 3R8]
MRVTVITPPEPVVTPQEAAVHLRLGDSFDERSYLEDIIAAATQHIDGPAGWLGRAIGVQTLETYLPSFGVTSIVLPYPPAIEIVSIDYVDNSGAAITLDPADYELRTLLRPAWPKSWPSAQWQGCDGETVRIRYRAGYETIPAPIRAAILLMVGDLFEFRETVQSGGSVVSIPMSTTVENLLSPFRVWG